MQEDVLERALGSCVINSLGKLAAVAFVAVRSTMALEIALCQGTAFSRAATGL